MRKVGYTGLRKVRCQFTKILIIGNSIVVKYPLPAFAKVLRMRKQNAPACFVGIEIRRAAIHIRWENIKKQLPIHFFPHIAQLAA